MVLTSEKKKALALVDTSTIRIWDPENDFYRHLIEENSVLESGNEKFNYLNTLHQDFVVKDPEADSELMQFMGLSSIAESLVLHLQDQYREDTPEEEEEGDSDSAKVDLQYKYFRDHYESHGKSYVFDIAEDGFFLKYEAESLSAPGSPDVCATDSENHVSNESYKSKLRVRKPKAAKTPNVDTNRVASDSWKRRGKKLKGAKLSAAKNRGVNSSDVASNAHKRAGNCKGRRRGKRPKKPAVPMNVKGKEAENECEKEKQTDTPSGIETKVKEEIDDYDDDAPDIRRPVETPVLKVEHFWYDDEANAKERTEFREKLMNELKRPYCQEEHKRLLQDITVRKPVQHHRDLRGGIKIFEEDYLGKSFLDHHIDLAVEIDSARDDRPRVLNLLRGFFFWLSNLTHEGAFRPWRVPSCLDVLPQQ